MSIAKLYRPRNTNIFEAVCWDGTTAHAYEILAWVHRNGGRGLLRNGQPTQRPDVIEIYDLDNLWRATVTGNYVVRSKAGFSVINDSDFVEAFELAEEQS